jgi:hypothetical protein
LTKFCWKAFDPDTVFVKKKIVTSDGKWFASIVKTRPVTHLFLLQEYPVLNVWHSKLYFNICY